MDGLVSMQNQFSGLPIADLIGKPLEAACDAQIKMARATADFIQSVGFYDDNGVSKTRVADFSFKRHTIVGKNELGHDIIEEEDVSMQVPMLAIVNIPTLIVDEVDVSFDMEVKSATSDHSSTSSSLSTSGGITFGYGPFISGKVSIAGSVAAHKENTRTSDNSAKYHINIHAKHAGTPEGLSRVLDIIASSVAPQAIESPQAKKDKEKAERLQPVVNEIRKINKEIASLERKRLVKQNKLNYEKKQLLQIEDKSSINEYSNLLEQFKSLQFDNDSKKFSIPEDK